MEEERNKQVKGLENKEHLTPKELMKKHMENPDHVISQEEMENLNVDPEADEGLKQKEIEKLEELKYETGNHLPNPYDILDA